MKQIHIKMHEQDHAQLRLHCAQLDMSIQDFVVQNVRSAVSNPKQAASHFKFIDLFAGIGGIRLPFEELHGDCVFSSEIDK